MAVAVVLLAIGIATAGAVPTTRPFPAGARFDDQIGGAYRPPRGVTIVDRDRHDRPAPGRYNICYVNAFQAQPDELGWWRRHHPRLLLRDATGRLVIDHDWNEVLLDLSTPVKRAGVAAVVGGWIDGCARRGFDAIEPDNLDSWTRSQHLLSQADAIAFAALLSRRAHADGLLIAQKNAGELAGRRARTGFDFAIAEECQVYGECAAYTRAYGRRVIEIEYTDNGRTAFTQACATRGTRSSVELVDRDVQPLGAAGHVRAWCR
ncbi:MAG: endo alpha-1,4 polygalactosaminidase [Jatrophihabitans sp.]|uniref:endo alpha-1,4 polygalactosaminidase n=1 Tax=Jatrophihabitans sp. TaxID=1932789 RepID=UPI003F7FC89C